MMMMVFNKVHGFSLIIMATLMIVQPALAHENSGDRAPAFRPGSTKPYVKMTGAVVCQKQETTGCERFQIRDAESGKTFRIADAGTYMISPLLKEGASNLLAIEGRLNSPESNVIDVTHVSTLQ